VDIKLHWYFEDPAAFNGTDAAKIAKFCEVRDQIKAKVLDWLETLPQ
jgi:arsenate reductase